uniref:Uncharacterized protein n=1 Tax=Anguilla anguilla TaxID=7936 RepID=A0A0E9RSY8_ANGAN
MLMPVSKRCTRNCNLSIDKQGQAGTPPDNQEAFSGVLEQLIEKGQLSLELIKANITELMAGAVDTTAVPLQFALFELARNPSIQEMVRRQSAVLLGFSRG